jgi:hypothetical protein
MLDSFLRSVTKDSYGPVTFPSVPVGHQTVVVQKYHDAFSALNWGKMPDVLQNRGHLNALVFAHLNSLVQSETSWKEFLRSPDALTFRKAASSIPQSGNVSSTLNELAETFPIRSNFVGCVDENSFKNLQLNQPIQAAQLFKGDLKDELNSKANLYPVCEFFHEEKVPVSNVMGRAVWDYSFWKKQNVTKVLPFEFECHFALTEGSLAELDARSVALPKTASLSTLKAGTDWDFPLIELVLSQDPLRKRIDFSEALWMTEFSPEKLQKTILTAAWIASFVRYQAHKSKLKLNAVTLRFAMNPKGELMISDCLSMDDLHVEGMHVDESVGFYQKTSWFEAVTHAKKHADLQGLSEWKRLCAEPAPWLDPKVKQELESQTREMATRLITGQAGA